MNKFIRSLFSHPATKLFSLLLAVVVWFYAKSSESQEKVFQTQVVVQNLGEKYVLSDVENDEVSVRLSGRGLDLIKIQDDDISYIVDGSKIEEGRHLIELNSNSVSVSKIPVNIVSIDETDDLYITVEKRIAKRVPVRPYILGIPSPDFYISAELIVVPHYVTIYGREDIIENIAYISTEPVDIGDATESVSKTVKPISSREDITITSDISVLVTVPIIEYEEFIFEDIPVILTPELKGEINKPDETISITLKGPKDIISEISADDIKVYLNKADIESEESVVELLCDMGEQINVLSISPESISVVYK